MKRHHEIVRNLLQGGAEVNAKDEIRNQMMLMMMILSSLSSSLLFDFLPHLQRLHLLYLALEYVLSHGYPYHWPS